MTPWRFLPWVIGAIMALLALLIVSLQVASVELFYTFLCLWVVALVGLMCAPSQPRPSSEEVEEKKQADADANARGPATAASGPAPAILPKLMGRAAASEAAAAQAEAKRNS